MIYIRFPVRSFSSFVTALLETWNISILNDRFKKTNELFFFLYVLLTVHLSIILATDQHNAQILVL